MLSLRRARRLGGGKRRPSGSRADWRRSSAVVAERNSHARLGNAAHQHEHLEFEGIHSLAHILSAEPGRSSHRDMQNFLSPLRAEAVGACVLRNMRTGVVLASQILPAFDSAPRRTGLLQHTFLPEGVAMIIAPTSAIHTFFMKFRIDVAFVARDGRVLKICSDLPPWRMAAAWRACCVVEMAAHSFSRCDTRAGDRLTIEVIP